MLSLFEQLPERRKKLLEYLFIEDLTPKDAAGLSRVFGGLRVPPQTVYVAYASQGVTGGPK